MNSNFTTEAQLCRLHTSAQNTAQIQLRSNYQLIAITRTVHDFQSLTHFSTAQGSSQTQTLQLYGSENREKKLSRIYQHSIFQRASSKAFVVAVHTMFHSDMLQSESALRGGVSGGEFQGKLCFQGKRRLLKDIE